MKLTMFKPHSLLALLALVVAGFAILGGALIPGAQAQVQPGGSAAASGANIGQTRHNFSPGAPSRQTTSGTVATTEPYLESSSTGEVCVYCHTPHAGSNAPGKPLWNRADSNQTYTPYTSSSLNATDLSMDQTILGTPSKLCLSCHDGSIAIGSVTNAPGSGFGGEITFPSANFGATAPPVAGTMPLGRNRTNANHGFTRRLGTDFRNDHPISFTYDTDLANADGELRNPATSDSPTKIANRGASTKPNFPLVGGKVQCTTCHDPHRNTQKFLLKNRLAQGTSTQASWTDWAFDDANDQICLGCHTRLGKAWQQSAHADPTSANETYKTGDAAMRDFPTGTRVWQAGCLNCHDTHTVAGSRRLLREGVATVQDSLTPTDIGYVAQLRQGFDTSSVANYNATAATENTCYQCHSDGVSGRPIPVISPTLLSGTEGVPAIAGEFARTYRMPITNADQGGQFSGNAVEKHEVTDNNGMEPQTNLGYGVPTNRHVECTDCHNPHRVLKNARLDNTGIVQRTHVTGGTIANKGADGNIASGALRGIWGVQPNYLGVSTSNWPMRPESYTVKQGDPGSAIVQVGDGSKTNTFLTREYQLCFKCHSDYGNGPLRTDFPLLKASGNTRGGTPAGTNGLTRYTNVAAEFAVNATDPPTMGTDQGESGNDPLLSPAGSPPADSCAPAGCVNTTGVNQPGGDIADTQNHRSWHPVQWPTGRTGYERTGSPTGNLRNIRPPFGGTTALDAKVGYQTMTCTDCHGSAQSWTQGATQGSTANGPNYTQVQGPHGSDNPFLLKGLWSSTVPTINTASNGNASNSICGRCHSPVDANGATAGGFNNGDASHNGPDKAVEPCVLCHMAIPHGWKNKAFLNNLNCVGDEVAGYAAGCTAISGATVHTIEPYYNQAGLRIRTWRVSNTWEDVNCGSQSLSGRDWMSSVCVNN